MTAGVYCSYWRYEFEVSHLKFLIIDTMWSSPQFLQKEKKVLSVITISAWRKQKHKKQNWPQTLNGNSSL